MIENTATWLKGKHNMTFGGSMRAGRRVAAEPDAGADGELRPDRHRSRPTAMFNAANFPGASAADITQAQNLYAMLTGRITIAHRRCAHQRRRATRTCRSASRAPQGRMREFDFFAADSWRATPNADGQRRAALRAAEPVLSDQQQLHDDDAKPACTASPASATCSSPGTLTGTKPQLRRSIPAGTYAYNPDRNNFAPSVGLAWQLAGAERRHRTAAVRLARKATA